MRNQLPYIFLVLLFLTASSAWGSESEHTLHPVKGKPAAPQFSLTDINNTVHDLQQYRGKVLVINFWATWCPPCRYELPSMERAYQILQKHNVEFLAINVGEDADSIFTFTADYPVTFPLLMDKNSKIINQFRVIGLPTTFVVDPDGRLVYRAVGTRDWDDAKVLKKIRELLPAN